MTQMTQVGELTNQRPPASDDRIYRLGDNGGMLGNPRLQTPASANDFERLALELFNKIFDLARPDSKLDILKLQAFKPEGRHQRIAASLAALDAPQPTVLTLEQWREIAEETEDEDED
jgi:hypothetical protein